MYFVCVRYGSEAGKSLLQTNRGCGGHKIGLKCAGCDNFKLVLSNNKRNTSIWNFSVCQLEHEATCIGTAKEDAEKMVDVVEPVESSLSRHNEPIEYIDASLIGNEGYTKENEREERQADEMNECDVFSLGHIIFKSRKECLNYLLQRFVKKQINNLINVS